VHNYSKQFNLLAQYAPDQVDTDEKKKDRFMIGLSSKLQEHMVLNIGGTFPEFVSNVMIVHDGIRIHKEIKKRKDVAAPSGSAPPKYRTVYHHAPPTHPNSHSNTSTSVSCSSGLPTHLRASTSGQHLRLYLHLCL
jgi:hypothetical protein